MLHFLIILGFVSASLAVGNTCSYGCLDVHKIYDVDASGTAGAGEQQISGWLFKVLNLNTNRFVYYSTPFNLQLAPGQYQVCDLVPNEYNWYRTNGNGCVNVTITEGSTCQRREFDCLCLGPNVAKTSTYWFLGSGSATITEDDLAALRALNLKDAAGTDFDPVTVSQLKTWYQSVDTSNIRNYLSAQLAHSTLNTRHFVNAGVHVKAPNIGSLLGNPQGFPTLQNAQIYANLLLAMNMDPETQGYLALVLRKTNSNEDYVQNGPCKATFPPVSPMAGQAGAANFTVSCPPPPPPPPQPSTTGAACTYGCLDINKVYDLNGNGRTDSGEPSIPGWVFKVRNLDTNAWSFYEVPQQVRLPLGRYEVCDLVPQEYNWHLTSPSLCKNYTLTSPGCIRTDADCVCFGPGGARKPTYWMSAEGLASVTDADLQALRNANLKNSPGDAFNPVTRPALKAWYESATTSNVEHYLSTQLAIAILNTRHGVSGGKLVKAIAVAPLLGSENGLVKFEDLQELANGMLSMSIENEDEEGAVASALAGANVDKTFVQSGACPFSFASLPETNVPLRPPPCVAGLVSSREAAGEPYMCCDAAGPSCPQTTELRMVSGSVDNVVEIGRVSVAESADELRVRITLDDECWSVTRVDQYLSTLPLETNASGLYDPADFTYVKPLGGGANIVKGAWLTASIPGASRGCFDNIYAALHLKIKCSCDSCSGLSGVQDAWAAGSQPFAGQFGYSHVLRHCCDVGADPGSAGDDILATNANMEAKRAMPAEVLPYNGRSEDDEWLHPSPQLLGYVISDTIIALALVATVALVVFALAMLRNELAERRAELASLPTSGAPVVQPAPASEVSSAKPESDPLATAEPPTPVVMAGAELSIRASAPAEKLLPVKSNLTSSLHEVHVLRLRNSNASVGLRYSRPSSEDSS